MTSEKEEKTTHKADTPKENQKEPSTADLSRISESIKGITLPTMGSHETNPFALQTQPPPQDKPSTIPDPEQPPQSGTEAPPILSENQPKDSDPKK